MQARPISLVGWAVLILATSSLVYLSVQTAQRSSWYRERLLRRVLNGSHDQQVRAAATLAYLGGETELLKGLQSDNASAREVAQRALEYAWFTAAGPEPYKRLLEAVQAMERHQAEKAEEILDGLTRQYPRYAEGWNRRAALHWEQGRYDLSVADCRRALALNPNHYGAWQGLGICRLRMGDLAEACRCLKAALELLPHDQATRRALSECEELLQNSSPRRRPLRSMDFLRQA